MWKGRGVLKCQLVCNDWLSVPKRNGSQTKLPFQRYTPRAINKNPRAIELSIPAFYRTLLHLLVDPVEYQLWYHCLRAPLSGRWLLKGKSKPLYFAQHFGWRIAWLLARNRSYNIIGYLWHHLLTILQIWQPILECAQSSAILTIIYYLRFKFPFLYWGCSWMLHINIAYVFDGSMVHDIKSRTIRSSTR